MLSPREGLDDEHRGAAVPADEGRPVGSVIGIAVPGLSGRSGWRLMQELANGGDIVSAASVGEEAVVSDPMEARRQHMQ